MRNLLLGMALITTVCVASSANAQALGDLKIELEHGNATDFSLTPLWFGFHNGAFDSFDAGSAASASIEAIAELGDVGPITAEFSAAPGIPGDIQGVAAAAGNGVPPIEPGETGVGYVTPINPSGYQYFSFLSMLVPTNDTFIGNDNPLAYRVFNDDDQLIDENGIPVTERVITLFASDIYDSGTEVNSGFGAAFTQGQVGTDGTDEGGVVTAGSDLSAFLGATDVTGRLIDDPLGSAEVLATIRISQVVPEPASGMLLLAGLAVVARRRS